jgi:hypothetical protein
VRGVVFNPPAPLVFLFLDDAGDQSYSSTSVTSHVGLAEAYAVVGRPRR